MKELTTAEQYGVFVSNLAVKPTGGKILAGNVERYSTWGFRDEAEQALIEMGLESANPFLLKNLASTFPSNDNMAPLHQAIAEVCHKIHDMHTREFQSTRPLSRQLQT